MLIASKPTAPNPSAQPVTEQGTKATGLEDREIEEGELVGPDRGGPSQLQESVNGPSVLFLAQDCNSFYRVKDLEMSVATVAYERYEYTGETMDLVTNSEQTDWGTACKLLGNGKWSENTSNDLFKEKPPSTMVQDQFKRHLYLIS
ncbi:hypothetical protein PM082_024967 [Marasmius tenuissimus]|nr:hypothetical protein PM082_024967 [Marasmius tenuissimus]